MSTSRLGRRATLVVLALGLAVALVPVRGAIVVGSSDLAGAQPAFVPPPCTPGAELFNDVPASSPFCPWIEELANRGVVAGCGIGAYCPVSPVTRAQMSVFLLRTLEGSGYLPPACMAGAELFNDVSASSPFCPWIEELANRGIAAGCGGGNYCPGAPVTRGQMAVFLLKTVLGGAYVPRVCSVRFADVPCPSLFADWIEDLFARGVTGGCGSNPPTYCPGEPVARQQMPVFVLRMVEGSGFAPASASVAAESSMLDTEPEAAPSTAPEVPATSPPDTAADTTAAPQSSAAETAPETSATEPSATTSPPETTEPPTTAPATSAPDTVPPDSAAD